MNVELTLQETVEALNEEFPGAKCKASIEVAYEPKIVGEGYQMRYQWCIGGHIAGEYFCEVKHAETPGPAVEAFRFSARNRISFAKYMAAQQPTGATP